MLPPSSNTLRCGPSALMPSPPLRSATFDPTCQVPLVSRRPVPLLPRNELSLIVPSQFPSEHETTAVPLFRNVLPVTLAWPLSPTAVSHPVNKLLVIVTEKPVN